MRSQSLLPAAARPAARALWIVAACGAWAVGCGRTPTAADAGAAQPTTPSAPATPDLAAPATPNPAAPDPASPNAPSAAAAATAGGAAAEPALVFPPGLLGEVPARLPALLALRAGMTREEARAAVPTLDEEGRLKDTGEVSVRVLFHSDSGRFSTVRLDLPGAPRDALVAAWGEPERVGMTEFAQVDVWTSPDGAWQASLSHRGELPGGAPRHARSKHTLNVWPVLEVKRLLTLRDVPLEPGQPPLIGAKLDALAGGAARLDLRDPARVRVRLDSLPYQERATLLELTAADGVVTGVAFRLDYADSAPLKARFEAAIAEALGAPKSVEGERQVFPGKVPMTIEHDPLRQRFNVQIGAPRPVAEAAPGSPPTPNPTPKPDPKAPAPASPAP